MHKQNEKIFLNSESINKRKNIKYIDHRKIGQKLDLYYFQNESPGMVFWSTNGLTIFHEIKKFIRSELKKHSYHEVKSPLIMKKILWEKTGHWDNFKENMFSLKKEKKKYCIKPMNCPGHIQIFKKKITSYKDLPIRISEFGTCYRNEPSGSLYGLMRLQEFTQDDAHIFCTEKQILNEIKKCIKMIYKIYNIFGFRKISAKLSTRPKNKIGTDEIWNKAESDLVEALNNKFDYQYGDGAFYGPKIDFNLCDSLNRTWQCGTIQLDFSLSKKLKATYIDKKNNKRNPVIIHRAIIGSLERFIGILIEHHKGSLPTWLSPVQVVIINTDKKQRNFIKKLVKKLCNIGIRAKEDLKSNTVALKVRNYSILKIPYIGICGQEEIESDCISIRTCNGKNLGKFKIKNFIKMIQDDIISGKTYRRKSY
ncbi:hypothetical protein AOQ88_00235 [Candidatus Riesia sp. GBBU]|nr:hypothetical protein AOQ88_00235 [Candidatus Riesia sp. GBBU]